MIFLFLFFLFLFAVYYKKKSIAVFLIGIQLLSIGGFFFMGRSLELETISDYSLVAIVGFILFLIVAPWKDYYGVKEIKPFDEKKLKYLTKFLIGLNAVCFVILLTIVIIVQTMVQDINEFKYTEGVNQDFIAANLPFPNFFFSFAVIFSNFSYFLIPLHFYYLFKKKYVLSIICLVLSLNVILIGLTYFSRAVVVQYMLLYTTMLFLHYRILDAKVKKVIRLAFISIFSAGIIYFLDISVRRFEQDSKLASNYSTTIPVDAITQSPLVYSYLDYTSQGYANGFEVLKIFEGETFEGTLTFDKILAMISTPYEKYMMLSLRQKLWPYEYGYSFNGFPAYIIYDFGIIGGLLFCLVFYFVVKSLRPKNGVLLLKNDFVIVLLVQVPLMAIFYNQFAESIIAVVLLIPIWIYLQLNFKTK